MKLKLHLNHRLVADLELNPEDPLCYQRFVVCYMPDDKRYASWTVDAEGNCYHGHYMMSKRSALNLLSERAGLTTPTTHEELA